MSSVDRVYGAIFSYVGSETNLSFSKIGDDNLLALNKLPGTDEYPHLTQNMFSITSNTYRTPGLYKEQAIHFAGTFKDIYESWDIWLDKFESLLEILHWNSVYLHLELSNLSDQDGTNHFNYHWTKGLSKDSEVKFIGGPREFGNEIKRTRLRNKETIKKLEKDQENVELLIGVIRGLSRIREYQLAYRYLEQLEKLDKNQAKQLMRSSLLMSWKEAMLK